MVSTARTTPFLAPFSDKSAAVYALSRHVALKRLSSRQVEVAWLVADGYCDKEIARQMGVGDVTVRTYVQRIAKKLDLNRDRNLRTQITTLVILAWAQVEMAA